MSPLRDRNPVTLRAWCAAAFGYGAFLAGAVVVLFVSYRVEIELPTALFAAAIGVLLPPIALSWVAALVVSFGRRRALRLLSIAVFIGGLPAALFPLPGVGALILGLCLAFALLAAFPYTLLLADVARAGAASATGGSPSGLAASGLGVASFALGALAVRVGLPEAPPADWTLLGLSGLLAVSVVPFLLGGGQRPPGPPGPVALHLARALATAAPLRRLAAVHALLVGPLVGFVLLLRGHVRLVEDPRLAEFLGPAEVAYLAGAVVAPPAVAAAARGRLPATLAAAGGAGAIALALAAHPSPALLPVLLFVVGAAAGSTYALLRAAALRLPPEAGGAPLGAAVSTAAVPLSIAAAAFVYLLGAGVGGEAGGPWLLAIAAALGAAGALFLPAESPARPEAGPPA